MKKFFSTVFVLFLFWGGWFGESIASSLTINQQITERIPPQIASREKKEVRISLKEQTFGLYEKGKLVFGGRICSGRKGNETPRGKFRVLGKSKNYFSKKYQCKMPFAVRFTDQGHFLHQGTVFPWPNSHGCVRMSEENAKRLFNSLKIKDVILITD